MLRTLGVRRLTATVAAGLFLGLLAAAGSAPAHAQPIRPWTPPSSDSLLAWAADARARFRTNAGDSIGGGNFEAYNLVGRIARRMLRALGEQHMLQAHAIEPAIDSLGLDVEVAIDPAQPTFALVMVHNPFRATAGTVGWLYWFRRDDLRAQGVAYTGGREPRMKVWYSATPSAPYEWAVLDRALGKEGYNFTLFRLDAQGYYWRADQFEGYGPDLRDATDAGFMDINHDGRPELLAWAEAAPESLFETCKGCPLLFSERIYTLTPRGYELDESRMLSTTYSTFVLFVRLLRQQNRVAAGRLLEDPAKLDRAIALGWAAGSGRGVWKVERVETDRSWPSWLALRFRSPKGEQHWVVHFTQKEGRWVIKDWLSEDHRGTTRLAPPAAADTIRVNRGGQPQESR
jgi:hypothetical protein